ncbi:MAG: BatA domain-containing protein [Candidatus Omnitrophica bacterium]|nr:BatA domain-containing protein [Candidatus Omnitrophota bacterium]
MSFLSPLGFLGLLSVPVVLWLWRLAASRRRLQIPSLIPFEHLLRRAARRRTHLVVNPLFWMQLAGAILLALALARPALRHPGGRTVLAILDTSASMAARRSGSAAFDRARTALRRRLMERSAADEVMLVATAPLQPAVAHPRSDAATIHRALDEQRTAALGGNLASAVRLGSAMLPKPPDEIIVATDEPRPEGLPARVQWLGVGETLANVALAGVEARGPLCAADGAHLAATIHNFSSEPSTVTVRVLQGGAPLAQSSLRLEAGARRVEALSLPANAAGDIEVQLQAQPDALSLDNAAHLTIPQHATLPVVLRVASPELQRGLREWLTACAALQWSTEPPAADAPFVLITDREVMSGWQPSAVLRFDLSANAPRQSTPVHWLVANDHPLGAYVAPVDVVSVALNPAATADTSAVAVISAVRNGRKIPVVLADAPQGVRRVTLRFDPSISHDTTTAIVVVFNSLRWLMGDAAHATGLFNALESNLMDRTSTWRPLAEERPPSAAAQPTMLPLAPWLLLAVLALLVIEWWLYARRTSQRILDFRFSIADSSKAQSTIHHPPSEIHST